MSTGSTIKVLRTTHTCIVFFYPLHYRTMKNVESWVSWRLIRPHSLVTKHFPQVSCVTWTCLCLFCTWHRSKGQEVCASYFSVKSCLFDKCKCVHVFLRLKNTVRGSPCPDEARVGLRVTAGIASIARTRLAEHFLARCEDTFYWGFVAFQG